MAKKPVFGPTCPFCHAPWSEANLQVMELNYDNYESMGLCIYDGTLTIMCGACDREMYRKEGVPVRTW